MKISTYTYNENYTSELQEENVTLAKAMNQLKKEEIHFFKIEDETGIIEITLSDKNEIITNGYEDK